MSPKFTIEAILEAVYSFNLKSPIHFNKTIDVITGEKGLSVTSGLRYWLLTENAEGTFTLIDQGFM